ncbi:MAG TPA: hypothetical protein VK141_00705, partial [Nitrosomonas sp.]|nr:hypothetical protein [Nitrosomonas sp.]
MVLSLHLYSGHGLDIQSPIPKSVNSTENLPDLRQAWAQPGAMTSMINWYRAVVRHMPKLPKDPRIKVPTLMMWGMKDVALSHRMARPSM